MVLLEKISRIVCASHQYIEKYGSQHPHDLQNHNILLYQMRDKLYNQWEFKDAENVLHKVLKGNRIANDSELVQM